MKLIIRIFAAALLAGALTACTGSKTDNDDNGLTARQKIMLKSLEMEVAKVNKELPLDTGEGLTLTGMAIENGYLVSTCTYAEGSQLGIDQSDVTDSSTPQSYCAEQSESLSTSQFHL